MQIMSLLRILVVDDTAIYRMIVRDLLSDMDGVEVVGTAANGKIAIDMIQQVKPDLLTLDLEMPEVDGLGVLKHIQETGQSVGAIMLSAFTADGAETTVNALEHGAFDFVLKPSGAGPDESMKMLRADLFPKIEAFLRSRRSVVPARAAVVPHPAPPAKVRAHSPLRPPAAPELVVIGISTGGPQALNVLMPMLPANFPLPILIVQHMPPMFTKSLADGLNSRCALSIREATDGDSITPGMALIAPGGKQMKTVREGARLIIRITDDEPVNNCKPSVDFLFDSVAKIFGGNTLAMIMTGMGHDGTAGCRKLHGLGATILAQDEASCVVYGMPKKPVDEGLVDAVLPLSDLAGAIVQRVRMNAAA